MFIGIELKLMKKITKDLRLYNIDIPIIGITGGIACGKTTFSQILKKKGYPVINADQLVKKIYSENETLQFIKKNYPEAVVQNTIQFNKLREWFFKDQANQNLVESFIYKKLENIFIKERKKFSKADFLFYDVALLFEKSLDSKLDFSVCVHISREEQINRLIKRDRISKDLALKIISKQIPIDDKMQMADFLINNSQNLQDLEEQACKLLLKITAAK